MNRHQLNVFTALIKVLDKELLTTLLFSKCKTLAFMLLWYIACLDGAKIDGQHDVDDLCRNNYLINVKFLLAYIFAHHLKYWILQSFWFAKYNVHICSNGGLYHTVKVTRNTMQLCLNLIMYMTVAYMFCRRINIPFETKYLNV